VSHGLECKGNIEIDLKQKECNDVVWNLLAQHTDQWQVLFGIVISLLVSDER
jgi:hypothetical protein